MTNVSASFISGVSSQPLDPSNEHCSFDGAFWHSIVARA